MILISKNKGQIYNNFGFMAYAFKQIPHLKKKRRENTKGYLAQSEV